MAFPDAPIIQIEPLVAHPFPTQPRIFTLYSDVWHRSSAWSLELSKLKESRDISKTQSDEFSVVVKLKEHLAPYRNSINIPGSWQQRLIFPLRLYKSHSGFSAAQRELELSKCLAFLQLGANPDLRIDLNNPGWTMLYGCFAPERFDVDSVNLLFSYGLSFKTYQHALEEHMRESKSLFTKDSSKTIRELSCYLSDEATDEEKIFFCQAYGCSTEALEVNADNLFYKCYATLRDAYTEVKAKQYSNACQLYTIAMNYLANFKCEKLYPHLSPAIRADYQMRYNKCVQYIKACEALAQKTEHQQSLIQKCISITTWGRKVGPDDALNSAPQLKTVINSELR